MEPEELIKVVELPYSGVADAKPLRPFAAPPKEIDLTDDCAYEKEWMPMKVAKKREEIREKKRLRMEGLMRRKDSGAVLDQIRDQEMAHFAKYRYDKGYVQQVLFEGYLDQAEDLEKMKPHELAEDVGWWKKEAEHVDDSKKVIDQLKGI